MQLRKDEKDKLILFFLLAFIIPWICTWCLRVPLLCNNVASNMILYGTSAASPTLAVLLLTLKTQKSSGLHNYLRRKYVEHFSIRMCIYAAMIPFLILSGAKVVSILMGDRLTQIPILSSRKVIIIAWALFAEELGWRGFLQEYLEKVFKDWLVPFVIGIIWALWHYHFWINGTMNVPIMSFVLGCVFESYGYFAVTKLAKDNILPASIWHFTGNLVFNLYRFDPKWHNGIVKYYWIATVCYACNIFIFLIWKFGCKNRKI